LGGREVALVTGAHAIATNQGLGSEERRVMCRLRLGVVWEQSQIGHGRECQWCGEKPTRWTEHVMGGCKVFAESEGEDRGKVDEVGNRERIRAVLDDWGEENVKRVAGRVRRFNSRGRVTDGAEEGREETEGRENERQGE